MTEQYIRKVRCSFNGGFVVNPGGPAKHELKIGFNVTKGISSSANTADIEIYNLTESHRNAMGKEFDEVTLEAGYYPFTGGRATTSSPRSRAATATRRSARA